MDPTLRMNEGILDCDQDFILSPEIGFEPLEICFEFLLPDDCFTLCSVRQFRPLAVLRAESALADR